MDKKLYHQSENTFRSEFSSRVYSGEDEFEPLHFHKNFEMIIVISGRCRCMLGGKEYDAREGEAIFICPFQIHGFTLEKDSVVRRITFHEHLILTLSQTLDGRRPQCPVFLLSDSLRRFCLDRLESLFGKESGMCQRINPSDLRMQVKGFLYMLGGEFVAKAELCATPTSDTVTMAVAQYISENFRSNVTLQDVAREKGYNYQYLSRIFNRVMGMSFKKMLNLYRLENAYALLQDTDKSISEICFESGFQSIRSFNQVCRETYGMSPKELKRL